MKSSRDESGDGGGDEVSDGGDEVDGGAAKGEQIRGSAERDSRDKARIKSRGATA